jgi:hypothetical protein
MVVDRFATKGRPKDFSPKPGDGIALYIFDRVGAPAGVGPGKADPEIMPVNSDAGRVERMLPATLSDIAVGGGGRFLALTIPAQRKVALFDASEGKIVHYFPLLGDNARVAAGRQHLIVAYPDAGLLQRWNLLTHEKELTVNSPFQQTIDSVTMGPDSDGPILAAFKSGTGFRFLDLKFKAVDVAFPQGNFERPGGHPVFLHPSADGTIFGCRDGVGGEPHRVHVLNVNGKDGKCVIGWIGTSMLVPSSDGRYIYTGIGVYTPELKLVFPDKENRYLTTPFLPAVHGPYFMRLEPAKQGDEAGGRVTLFYQGNFKPFATIANIDGVVSEQIAYGRNRDSLPYSKRVFLIPSANLIVSVPQTNDRLVLHRVDMMQLLDKSPINYLLVASAPPAQVGVGKELQYKIEARSKKGGVTFSLEAGPKGMTVSPQGNLQWAVPADAAPGEEAIIVAVRDSTGQEVFHTFRLRVVAADSEQK